MGSLVRVVTEITAFNILIWTKKKNKKNRRILT